MEHLHRHILTVLALIWNSYFVEDQPLTASKWIKTYFVGSKEDVRYTQWNNKILTI